MKEYRCIKKCFHKNRMFTEGETLIVEDNEKVPSSFTDAVVTKKAEAVENEPTTFAELQRKEAQDLLDSVGKGIPDGKRRGQVK